MSFTFKWVEANQIPFQQLHIKYMKFGSVAIWKFRNLKTLEIRCKNEMKIIIVVKLQFTSNHLVMPNLQYNDVCHACTCLHIYLLYLLQMKKNVHKQYYKMFLYLSNHLETSLLFLTLLYYSLSVVFVLLKYFVLLLASVLLLLILLPK